MSSKPVSIDVVSDVMCPWCYIGKRRLEKALELIGNLDTTVRWRPFQLDATLPVEGKDRQTYLDEKFGGADRATQIYANIRQAGETEGLDFQFDKITRSPNTLDCHRLIRWAQAANVQDDVVESLFKAYFVDGADLTDHGTLLGIAEACGMDRDLVQRLLGEDADLDKTQAEIREAQQLGVTGVPCFIIDNRYAVMGAEAATTLANAIMRAANERDAAE